MKFSIVFLLVASTMLFITPGCNSDTDKINSIKHYDLEKAEKFYMPESLLEISGITFYDNDADSVYAIQDEQGRVFRLALGEKKQYNAKFGKQGDYEDLAITRENVFILKSNGTLFSFGFDHITEEEVDSVTEWKAVVPKGEYEAMSVDQSGNLVVICKKCAGEKNKEFVSGYIIEAGDSLQAGGSFNIDVAQIKAISGKVKRGFRPSGLARNPVTGEWFIISSINKLLVVTDQNWKVKEACQLDGNMFNQPEGIAFDKQGNLYISNEGDDLSQGNILKFRRAG